jgi:hypothetical protein
MAKTLLSFLTKMILLAGLLLTEAGGAMAQSAGDISFVGIKAGRSAINIDVRPQFSTHKTIPFAEAWWQVNNFTVKENSSGWQRLKIPLSSDVGIPFKNSYTGPVVVSPRIDGPEGWRALSAPVQAISFKEWVGDFWMQGMIGSDDAEREATILKWNEEGGYLSNPQGMAELTEAGKGYFIYFREDDDPTESGVQGGFPKVIVEDTDSDQQVVDVAVTATDANKNGIIDGDEGFNLLGNPFGSTLSVAALKGTLEQANYRMNAHLYSWDPRSGNGNGGIDPLSGDDTIAPYEAFWVRYLDPKTKGLVRMDSSSLVKDNGRPIYNGESSSEGGFELYLGGEEWFDSYRLEFNTEGAVDEDPLDGYKLFSLNTQSINLYSTIGNGKRLALNTLPNNLEEQLEVPLSFSAPNRQKLSFRWEQPEGMPNHWEVFLTDRRMDREINLRTNSSYSFQLEETKSTLNSATMAPSEEQLLRTVPEEPNSEGRFALVMNPSGSFTENVEEATPESISLNPNFPNPFTTITTIPFELVEKTDVKLTIWNMIGQKIATLIDGIRGPNDKNQAEWDASNMPSGMYIARLEAGGEVFTRKMTLIK